TTKPFIVVSPSLYVTGSSLIAARAVPASESATAATAINLCIRSPWVGGKLTLGRVRLFRDRGAPLPVLSFLLEGVRELQHAEVVAIAPDDLQAHGQALGRETGRHRDRRVAGDGDVVAALHPVEIVGERHAGDLARPFHIDREGR